MREKVEREGVGQSHFGDSCRSHHGGYVHRLDKVATSYFFTNFSEEIKAVDLWPRFARYGRVGEVFIPAKEGNRFGFVKFRDVRDAKVLLRDLSNIWVGSFKLRINLSKFSRRTEPRSAEHELIGKSEGRDVTGGGLVQGGRSFKEALSVDEEDRRLVGQNVGGGVVSVVVKEVPEVVWEVEVVEERLMKLEGAFVGYLVEEKDVVSLQNNFRMSGFQSLKGGGVPSLRRWFLGSRTWIVLIEKLGSGVMESLYTRG
ncbi:endonuclease/exonuclease/phosphatase family protein, partial [Trifolium medium]|nr:endonuclease/exonuclease/phosphatase family protein [Trifolium medium]